MVRSSTPRDPEGTATLGRAPSGFGGNNGKVAALIAKLLRASSALRALFLGPAPQEPGFPLVELA